MKFLSILFISLSFNLFAQSFKPDQTGRVNSEAFTSFCKKKGYELVGTFDSLPVKGMAAQVVRNNKWFYIDLNGKEFADHDALAKHYGFYVAPEPYYDEMPPGCVDEGVRPMPVPFSGKKPPFTGVFSNGTKYGYKYQDKIIIKPVYDEVNPMNHNENMLFIRVSQNGLYGVCDYQGKLIIPVAYTQLETLPVTSAQCFFTGERNGKTGILSRAGKVSVPFEYDRIIQQSYSDKYMFHTFRNNLMGALSAQGKTIVPPVYNSVHYAYGGAPARGLVVEKDRKFGYLDLKGTVKIPLEYENLSYNEENFLTFRTATGIGALDTSGLLIFQPVYRSIVRPKGGNCFLVSEQTDKTAMIHICDLKGNRVEESVFQDYRPFGDYEKANEFYLFSKADMYDKTGLFNVRTLKWAFPCKYGVREIGENYIVLAETVAEDKQLYGVFGKSGKFIIPVKYSDLEYIEKDKMATACYNGKYGVVGPNDTQILPFKYETLISVHSTRNAAGIVHRLPAGYFIYTVNGLSGVVDIHGKTTIPPVYEKIQTTAAALICTSGDTSNVITPAGKTYFTAAHEVSYSLEGIFYWNEGNIAHGFDIYGRQGIMPRKQIKRKPWEDPSVPDPPMPVPIEQIDRIYDKGEIEEEPQFPGGRAEMMRYISKNLVYPETAIENGFQGKCYISFIVRKDGSITDIKIRKNVPNCPECDKASKDLIKKMPAWIPAKLNGKAVPCTFTLPITFKL